MPYRTVKNGRIKLGGAIFAPNGHHMAYDGRLDGERFLFLEYPDHTPQMLALWGTEYKAANDVPPGYIDPECVNGEFPWYFWFEVTDGH